MLLRVRIQLLYCVYLFKLEYWLCICEHLQFELQNMKFCFFFYTANNLSILNNTLLFKAY